MIDKKLLQSKLSSFDSLTRPSHSRFRSSASSLRGRVNAGQPLPDSYLSSLAKSGAPQPAQKKTPRRFSRFRPDRKRGSVALSRSTAVRNGFQESEGGDGIDIFGAGEDDKEEEEEEDDDDEVEVEVEAASLSWAASQRTVRVGAPRVRIIELAQNALPPKGSMSMTSLPAHADPLPAGKRIQSEEGLKDDE